MCGRLYRRRFHIGLWAAGFIREPDYAAVVREQRSPSGSVTFDGSGRYFEAYIDIPVRLRRPVGELVTSLFSFAHRGIDQSLIDAIVSRRTHSLHIHGKADVGVTGLVANRTDDQQTHGTHGRGCVLLDNTGITRFTTSGLVRSSDGTIRILILCLDLL